MKKIETVIHPQLWPEARAALQPLGMRATLREVQTFGHTAPRREVYRGSAYLVELTTELELAIVVEDAQAERVISALQRIAMDAEVIVTTVEATPRLRPEIGIVRAALPVPASAAVPARLATVHAWSARAF